MSYYDRDKAPNDGSSTYTVSGNLGWPRPHLNHTPEYQASGFPFAYTINNVDSTDIDGDNTINETVPDNTVFAVSFPSVTRWLTVSAHKGNDRVIPDSCHIAFNENGFTSGNFVDSRFSGDIRLELKVSKVYIRFTDSSAIDHVEILAGLTNISSTTMDHYHAVATTANGGINMPGLNTAPTIVINP